MTTEFLLDEGIKHYQREDHDHTRCAPCALRRENRERMSAVKPMTLTEVESMAKRSRNGVDKRPSRR